MKLEQHVTVSGIISGIIFLITKSWEMAIANLISGIFIDLDHFVDYMAEYGLRFNIKEFFNVCYEQLTQKVFVILHAWEWMILIIILAWYTKWNVWVVGILIGYIHHMVMDQWVNAPKTWSYSILWRIFNNFERKYTFRVNGMYLKKCIKKTGEG